MPTDSTVGKLAIHHSVWMLRLTYPVLFVVARSRHDRPARHSPETDFDHMSTVWSHRHLLLSIPARSIDYPQGSAEKP
jgi:hypothetical protein